MEKFVHFNDLFGKAQSNIAEYKGETIYACYDYDLKGVHNVKFRLIFCNPDAERLLMLFVGNFKGKIYNSNGEKIKLPKGKWGKIFIFSNELEEAKEIVLRFELQEGTIMIENSKIVEVSGKYFTDSTNRWFAMKKEEISPTITRYYCNDSDNEDDFDDLIFEMEILD